MTRLGASWWTVLLAVALSSTTAAAQEADEGSSEQDEEAEPEQTESEEDEDGESEAESESEPTSESEPESEAEAESEAESEAEPESEAEAEAEPESEAEPEAEPESEAEAESKPEAEAAPATEGAGDETQPEVRQAFDDETPPEHEGPVIEMPEEQGEEPAAAATDDADLTRGLQQQRFERAKKTSVGGYGELHFNYLEPEGEDMPSEAELDMHRLVLFFAHNFDEDFRFYSEVEIEHGFVVDTSGGDAPGKVAIEQAYVDWLVAGDALGLRAGVVLVPMGIINQWHEPPIFNAVERPMVDKVVIPTTWSEGGVGIFGQPTEALRYELYLVGGLDPSGFSAEEGIRGGRLGVGKAAAKSPAITGRLELEPMLGLVMGVSGYFNMAGQNAERNLPDSVDGKPDVPVGGVAADFRVRKAGFEARAVAAYFGIGDHRELNDLAGTDVDEDIFGAYGEVGYDVLHPTAIDHDLVPFVRVEWYDTTLNADDFTDIDSVIDLVLGLTYRPIPQVAFKADTIIRFQDVAPGIGDDTLFNLGVGWMF